MNRLSQGAGIGLGAVGLGPVRIDFKDWVKAGREAREGSVEEENQHASERYSLGSHRESGGNRESEPAWGANDTDGARRDSGPVYDVSQYGVYEEADSSARSQGFDSRSRPYPLHIQYRPH